MKPIIQIRMFEETYVHITVRYALIKKMEKHEACAFLLNKRSTFLCWKVDMGGGNFKRNIPLRIKL